MATESTTTIQETHIIYASEAQAEETLTKLSIIDCSVANYTPSGCIWFYRQDLDVENIKSKLASTLNSYRQFTGRLLKQTIGKQQGIVLSSFGTSDDPGLHFVLAKDSRRLTDLIPSSGWKEYRPIDDLYPANDIGFSDSQTRSVSATQITSLADGGFAMAVKIHHCLADATTLLHFVRTWTGDDKVGRPVFDPHLLDTWAETGNKDETRIICARALPIHRFDLWHGLDIRIPEEIVLSPSTLPPWSTWDRNKSVDNIAIRFSLEEVLQLRTRFGKVSRQDALLSHVWTLVNRARQAQGTTYLDITLGLRTRIPFTGPNFMGSPILLIYVTRDSNTNELDVASRIRESISKFTHEAVSDHLYDASMEFDPCRLWKGFLGSQHILCTSWVGLGVDEVRFGNHLPIYSQALMPRLDGLLQIVDDRSGDYLVYLSLEREAAQRLFADPMLHII